MSTDTELLRRYVQEYSEPAFTELVQRHVGLVYSVALRRLGGDAHLAEDVTQTVFNDLARKAATLRDRATIGGWLYVSANHASAAMVRSERRRKTRELAAHAMHTPNDSDTDPEWTRLRPVIDEAIVGLKDQDREAIAMRYFEQRSFHEIAAALRLTDEAARKRVDRGLEKLRVILQRRGVDSTAGALGLALSTIGSTPAPAGLGTKIAGHAIATAGAAGSGMTLGGWLGLALPTAALFVLGGFIAAQRSANETLRSDLGRFAGDRAALASLQTENRELARRLADLEGLRAAAAAPLPEMPRPRAVALPPTLRPVAADIVVTAENAIRWNGYFLSLGECIKRLRQTKLAADPESRVHVRGLGSYSAVTYVIEEARKAGIEHLTVEGNAKPSDTFSWWWQ